MKTHPAASIALTLTALALAGCGGGQPPATAYPSTVAKASDGTPNQDELCEASTIAVARHCRPGQKVIFLPSTFGNEQLPVMFAALNCDLRLGLVSTKGAVVCILQPTEREGPEQNGSRSASTAAQ